MTNWIGQWRPVADRRSHPDRSDRFANAKQSWSRRTHASVRRSGHV